MHIHKSAPSMTMWCSKCSCEGHCWSHKCTPAPLGGGKTNTLLSWRMDVAWHVAARPGVAKWHGAQADPFQFNIGIARLAPRHMCVGPVGVGWQRSLQAGLHLSVIERSGKLTLVAEHVVGEHVPCHPLSRDNRITINFNEKHGAARGECGSQSCNNKDAFLHKWWREDNKSYY